MTKVRGNRATCENCQALDVRYLWRHGYLHPGQSFPFSWIWLGQPRGSVRIDVEVDSIVLRYGTSPTDQPPEKCTTQPVPIDWTSCAFGGRRPWFICSASVDNRACARRVAKLYLGSSPIFACRHCHQLAYASQFEPIGNRGILKAMRIRMRLGGKPNLCEPFPDRPKGLHRRTYNRLRKMHDAAESRLA